MSFECNMFLFWFCFEQATLCVILKRFRGWKKLSEASNARVMRIQSINMKKMPFRPVQHIIHLWKSFSSFFFLWIVPTHSFHYLVQKFILPPMNPVILYTIYHQIQLMHACLSETSANVLDRPSSGCTKIVSIDGCCPGRKTTAPATIRRCTAFVAVQPRHRPL